MRSPDLFAIEQGINELEKKLKAGQKIPSDIFPIDSRRLLLPQTLEFKEPLLRVAETVQNAAYLSIGGTIAIGTTVSFIASAIGHGY